MTGRPANVLVIGHEHFAQSKWIHIAQWHPEGPKTLNSAICCIFVATLERHSVHRSIRHRR
jgi:hypothetical protein